MPLVNRQNDTSDNFDKKLDHLLSKLKEIQGLMFLDGMLASGSVPEIEKLIEDLRGENTLQEILTGLSELKVKMDKQQESINKLISFISKLHQDGEINKDTFNKLDEFLKESLKPYYDTSNLAQDY